MTLSEKKSRFFFNDSFLVLGATSSLSEDVEDRAWGGLARPAIFDGDSYSSSDETWFDRYVKVSDKYQKGIIKFLFHSNFL